ncbi:3-ketodihydrosphingosine reductase [Halotydeus destructor]|nr:3-ketodihydrosphingosine reductase [Halotydeus destructor]
MFVTTHSTMLPVYGILIATILTGYLYHKWSNKVLNLKGRHVLITGGSKGIGKAMAIEAVRAGANVTILARNIEDLDRAKLEILKQVIDPVKQKIEAHSVDVSRDLYAIEQAVADAEAELGPVYMLVNCAGTSVAQRFDETPIDDFKRMMDINYMGSVLTTRAVLPSMKNQKEGVILFVSSVAGLLGLYGYSAYSASKFAIVGLAEVLSMELKPFNISVSVSFPPDTDTPGFEEEQKLKPIETKLISESGGLFSAQTVAAVSLKDAMNKRFGSTVGLESLMVRTVCSGMMPVSSLAELVWQVLTMPIFRIISAIFLNSCHRIVAKCAREKVAISESNNDTDQEEDDAEKSD